MILRLLGGLGNQLFIYAFGRALEINYEFDVSFDTYSGFKKDLYNRKFELDNFNVKIKTASLYESLFYPINKRTRIGKNVLYPGSILVEENDNFSIAALKELNKKYRNIYLQGYYQKSEFFENIKEELKKEIVLTKPLSDKGKYFLDKIRNINSVAVHIRLKERANKNNWGFYLDNINQLKKDLNNPQFFIFSDDIRLCKNNLASETFLIFIENTSGHLEDFWLMKNCKHFIISNSAFSWWASYLSSNDDTVIISHSLNNIQT